MRTAQDLTGKTFGKWQVTLRDYKNSSKNPHYFCRCVCGLIKSIDSYHLKRGKTISCRKCSEHKCKDRLGSRMWHRIKRSAIKRKLKVDLGSDKEGRKFLYDLLVQQRFICALSGLPIRLANTTREDMLGGTTASLDRIDSSKGYVKSNVQWVHKWINVMKWDFSQDEFITFCEAVVNHKRPK